MYRRIPGFSFYRITIDGDVQSIERIISCSNGKTQWTQTYHQRDIKWRINKHRDNETTVVVTNDNGVSMPIKVSHLVALAFPEICGVLHDGLEVDHIDTNRLNNNAYNLRVTDRKGNMGNELTRKHISDSADRKARSERMLGDKNPTRKPGYWTDERRKKNSEAQHKRYEENGSPCINGVRSINKNGDVVEYKSLSEAHKQTGTPVCQISAACLGRQKTAHGLKWEYI